MPLLTKPGLIQLKIEDKGRLLTTQINKINFTGSGVTTSVGEFNDITVLITGGGATSSAFPYTGSALITGSLGITGSLSTTGTVIFTGLINQTSPQTHVVTFNNTTGQLYITASSAFGGGGGGGSTPGGNTNTIQYNNAGVLDGSDNFKLVGGNFVYLTGSLLVSGSTFFTGSVSSLNGFTGSLFGTSSWAISASQAISSSYAFNATSASYALSSSQAVSSSYALSSSQANSASYALSASYASTASYSLNASDILVYVKNQSGNDILKGMVVRITGSNNSSDIPRIVTASYEADGLSANTLGIANENITNGNDGFVMTEGVLLGIDTTNYISGQLIYLGPTGSITGSAPLAPLHNVRLGQVVRHQTNNGSIYVRIDNGYEIGELHDVRDTTTTSSFGDLLIKSGSVWINSKSLTGSYSITGSLVATSFTGSFSGSGIIESASFAISSSQAVSASYALSSSRAISSSFAVSSSRTVSSSFASTASFVNPLTQSVLISGSTTISDNLTVNGDTTLNGTTVIISPASVLLPGLALPYSPSPTVRTVMFDALNNALFVTSSLPGGGGGTTTGSFTGSFIGTFTGSFSGSLIGSATSASYAFASTSASFATSASQATSASYALSSSQAVSASFAISSSRAVSSSFATSASYALSSSQAVSASYALSSSQALSSSFAVSASRAISSSFATSASYAPNTTFPYTGSALISGSLDVSGSIYSTGVITAAGNIEAQTYLKSMYQAGDEGGEIFLNAPATNTTIINGVTIDIYQDRFRIFEQGGAARGYFLDMPSGAPSATTNLKPAGYTGTVTIVGNPPPNNLNFVDGILISVT